LPVPLFIRSEEERITWTEVALMKVVGRAEPFHWATEFDSKPEPVNVIVAEALPVATLLGKIEVSTG
jgi:hypothetical protein